MALSRIAGLFFANCVRGFSALNPVLIAHALVLLTVANGAPVIMKKLLGQTASWPVDFNRPFLDGQPLFGPSKTLPGVVVGIVATAGAAPLLGLPWRSGAITACASMSGDLFSSFVKRRLHMSPSSRAPGLDQIPEALFGALAARPALPLTITDVVVTTIVFFVGQLIASRLSYEIGLRTEPY